MIEAGVLERCETESDTSRLGALFDAHHLRLYRLARRLAASHDDAQDLVQETFVRAAGRLQRVPPGGDAEEAWLVRVLINLSRDRWRRTKVRADAQRDVATPSTTSPEDGYMARLAVQRALSALSPRRRAVLVLHELEGMETAAIARLLGLATVTVRWHLSRGRAELAGALDRRDRRAEVPRHDQ